MSKKDLDDPGVGIIAQDFGTLDLGYGAVPPDHNTMSSGYGTDTIILDSSTMYSSNTITLPSSSYTISGAAGSTLYSTGTGSYNWNTTTSPTVNITGAGIDMAAGTDINIDGKSLKTFMETLEKRLAILVPDPKKLEKFEALKKAYEHYKLMEKLCQEIPKEEE